MVYRKLPQRLSPSRARIVLAAVMECRRSTRQAATSLPHGCPTAHALHGLMRAIDALRLFLTHLRRQGDTMDIAMRDCPREFTGGNMPNVTEAPGLLLGDLRSCRMLLIASLTEVAVMGATYEAIEMVLASMAALALLLTGDRDYFSGTGSGATTGDMEREARKRARERGEM